MGAGHSQEFAAIVAFELDYRTAVTNAFRIAFLALPSNKTRGVNWCRVGEARSLPTLMASLLL